VHALLDTHVYLWQEGEDVDSTEELDGEVLNLHRSHAEPK
jgi:hypothetical protein